MIKQLRYLCTLLLMAVASVAWGQSQSSLVFTAKCGGVGTADDGASWVVSSDAVESNFDSTKGVHFGTGKLAVSYLELSTSDIEGTITKIVVNASGASGTSASLGVTVGGVDFGSTQSLTSTATEYTFEGSASGEIKVRLSQASATKALYVKSIVVTYNNGAVTELLDPELAFVTTSATITLGDEFVLPELTNKGDGAVTYSSSNQNVATVDGNGIVDVKGAGTTVITAKSALTETYKAGSADFTLTVNNAPIVIVDGTFDFTGTEAYGSGLTPSAENVYIGNATTWTAGNVTLVAEGKYRWWYNANGNTLRFYVPKDETDEYNAGSMTISVPEGKVITKIVITGGKAFEANVGTYENGTWTGSNNSVVLTCTAGSNVETVTVTYGDGSDTPVVTVPAPTFNPAAGEVEAGTPVEIVCPDEAKGVEYRIGTEGDFAEYSDPIVINEATTIYARAYDADGNYSDVVSAAYTIKQDTPTPVYETVELPYEEKLVSSQGKFVIENVSLGGLEAVWKTSSFGMTANGYKCTGDIESWFVSPLIKIGDVTSVSMTFDQNVTYFASTEVAKEQATLWVREGAEGTWAQLTIPTLENVNDNNFSSAGTIDLSDYAGKTIQLGFKYLATTTSPGRWELKNLVVQAGEIVQKEEAGLSYGVDRFEATIGEDVVLPELQNPNGLDGITYSSTNAEAAKVDEAGTVTLVGAGQTTIKASFAGNDTFKSGDASYLLVVKEKAVSGSDKYELVTDASTLKAGDELIIASIDKEGLVASKAMSITQNNNNRADENIDVKDDDTVTPSSNIATIVLEGEEGAWLFRTTNGNEVDGKTNALGYLYAPGGGNYLRTIASASLESVGDKAKAKVDIDEVGNATIVFSLTETGSNAEHPRNIIRHNESSSLYSCYADNSSVSGAVQLYRKVTSTETVKGDVNKDGHVTIADVTALVNILLNKETSAYDLNAADVDGVNGITVADVEALVNIVLEKTN